MDGRRRCVRAGGSRVHVATLPAARLRDRARRPTVARAHCEWQAQDFPGHRSRQSDIEWNLRTDRVSRADRFLSLRFRIGDRGRMKAPRLFLESVSGDVAVGRALALPVNAAHHAADVLRMRTGDALTLFTGRGGEISTTIVRIAKRAVTVRVDAFDTVEREAPFDVTLVQALAANDAMDYALRKAVELGAAAVQPLTTARSARWPVGERGAQRLARWQQVAIAACEQCGRNPRPAIPSPTTGGGG